MNVRDIFSISTGTIVCGSPNEVAIASNLDDSDLQGSFTPFIWGFSIQSYDNLFRQKRIIWTEAALTGHDQLRQRVAWALAQIFVISSEIDPLTEAITVYYDIFVRHAFGNYRDIMKEVSFSPLMSYMLTYYGSRSLGIAWLWHKKIEYPDENFAREIMQLFTVGLVKLNDDGTPLLDSNNQPQLTYTNDDIMEYARVWTGFIRHNRRGNMEDQFIHNAIDPLMIDLELRDVYPKMGLNRRYIGDGYPLCSDMPKGHFLKKGATYRLIAKRVPEIYMDPIEWATDPLAKRLRVVGNNGSSLFSKLCGSQNVADCTRQTKVVLDEDVPCSGIECSLDTVRVVEISDSIYYEYVQRPCVYEAFFQNPKTIVPMVSWWVLVCADPRLSAASASHCKPNPNWSFNSTWIHEYWGERVTYKTATERTNMQCNRWPRPTCDKNINPSIGSFCSRTEQYFWTTTSCTLRAKIDYNGNIAIVHSPTGVEPQAISQRVQNETKTFFRVNWSGDVDSFISNCQQHSSCSMSIDGYCVCDVTVQNDPVFGNSDTMNPRLLENSLFVGAFEPNILGNSYTSVVVGDVTVHKKNGMMDSETIFEFIDGNGVRQLRKNVRSTVKIVGKDLSFRNPVHFIHFADRNRNQAYDETDAALDHYFYHPNTAPFLALRFAQRFGISNPSPGFIKRIANAFRTGYFESQEYNLSHGSGRYGDIGAMVLQILLDRESRSTILDADPTHGSLKEPILKLLGLMRGLGYTPSQDSGYIDFASNLNVKIGQMAHAIPNVFSFFLPEHKPSGRVAQASLVAPEAQIMTGPRTIDLMNGMLSLIKYGLSDCLGGFAASVTDSVYCQKFGLAQDNRGVSGKLSYTPRSEIPEDIVDDLASLLTAGRLSKSSRAIISNVIRSERNLTIGIVKAQQLMAFAPEFHSTNAVRATDIPRPEPNPIQTSSKPYKAVVYILLEGGMDSFNMLAPHTCSARNAAGKTLLEQYYQERTNVAISPSERSRIINAVGQPCGQFVIHQDLEIVERLYKQGNLAFFANTGVLNQPSNKDNWYLRQRTFLFAHNTMIMELLKIDAYDLVGGTGILGRVSDTLKKKGYKVQPISIQDANVATVGIPGQAVDPLIVSPYGMSKFNPVATGETFNPREYIDKLTNLTDLQSSIYGDTWSQRLQSALHDNKRLLDSLSGVRLSQTFPTTEYGAKLKSVASLISSHKERGTDRDVFFVQLNFWDHHSNLKASLSTQFKQLNGALTPFYEEMKVKGYWNNVTVVITSDFARTLTMNTGFGTDHAWGGNYFLMGGSVKGGMIHGNYPADITEDGPDSLGRGRLIPTLSFESMLNPIWQWLGVETAQELNYCMPNRIRTGTKMFQQSEVFNV